MAMPRLRRRHVVDDAAIDLERAGGDGLEPRDAAQQGRLAAARGADEDDELARLDVEVDVLEDLDVAVALVEIA